MKRPHSHHDLEPAAGPHYWGQDYNDGLLRDLDEASDDDKARAIILTSGVAGGAFAAGANLRDSNIGRLVLNLHSAAGFSTC